MSDLDTLKKQFEQDFGRAPAGVVRAPGRVNLIGEHTDYNDGYVLPIAIERQTLALWAQRDDMRVHCRSQQQPEPAEIDLTVNEPIKPGEPKWANYPKGVAAKLFEHGVALHGADILFSSDVPLGGGLSSSASLEVATALALMSASDDLGEVDGMQLAEICQAAEHEFAGAPCGIMDQAIAILAQQGHALLLDCFTGDTRQIPFNDSDVVLLVADTQVKHEISDGGYAARREQCQAAASELGVPSLRSADIGMVDSATGDGRLGLPERARARHVVGEIRRTLDAADALTAGDYEKFGALMVRSHESLRDDYEVSCEELDYLVELAMDQQGVYGARMTGGGFGGCMIVLVRAEKADDVSDCLAHGFNEKFGRRCPVFATR
ncbi:MAG: galactokinase, partial [Phycisphaerae bacterium]